MNRSIISSFLDLLIRTQVLVPLVLLPHLLSSVSTWCPMFSGVGLHNYYLSFIDTRHSVQAMYSYLWHIYISDGHQNFLDGSWIGRHRFGMKKEISKNYA